MTPRGQASDKPRGRKPRDAPMPFGEAKPLWGFDGSQSRPDAAIGPRDAEGDIAPMSGWRRREAGFLDDAAGEKRRYGSVRQSRPLSVAADEERTHR